jgi:hypothetical protein
VSKRLYYAEINDRFETEGELHVPQRWLEEGERRRRPAHGLEHRESDRRTHAKATHRRDRDDD